MAAGMAVAAKASQESDIDADILIVGAGPAGLYGAYYAGFRGMRTAVMDILPEPGGQIMAMYPEKEIMDIAGLPSVRGWHLIGTTPIRLFDPERVRPALFTPGDAVEFDAIAAAAFASIRRSVEKDDYTLEKTSLAE